MKHPIERAATRTMETPFLASAGAVWWGLVWLGCAMLVTSHAGAANPPDPMADGLSTSQRFEALVERVRIEQAAVDTMEADFEQTKQSSLLLEAELSRGRFLYRAPDRVLWEYESPNPIVMLIDDETMTTWYPDLDKVETQEVKSYSERIFKYLGASGSLDTMKKYFWLKASFPEAEGDPYRIELDPRFARVKRRIGGMEIHVDPEKFLPIYLKYVEPNGDWTEYRFGKLVINEPLPESRFELDTGNAD